MSLIGDRDGPRAAAPTRSGARGTHLFIDATAGRFVLTACGNKAASRPIAGKNEHNMKTNWIPVASASSPINAAPIQPRPNASPKNNPATVPTRNGTSSCP